MKKILSLVLIIILALSLTSCQNDMGEYLFEKSRKEFGMVAFDMGEGAVYVAHDNTNLNYLDYESGEFTAFCALPSCTHSDASCQGSIGDMSAFFIGGDKFYYLKSSIINYNQTDLYQSDLNRQNEKIVASFEGINSAIRFYYKNAVYMTFTNDIESEDPQAIENMKEVTVVGYDLKEGKVLGETVITQGYSAEVNTIFGIYNDKMILVSSYYEEAVDWNNLEDYDSITEDRIDEFVAIDTDTLDVRKADTIEDILEVDIAITDCQFLADDTIYHNFEGALYAYDGNKKENSMVFEQEAWVSGWAEDKIIFSILEDYEEVYLYNPQSKEVQRVYEPNGGDWVIGGGYKLWHEHGGYIYMGSTSLVGDEGKYEQNIPFIIKVNKEDIYKESYEAEIVS